jgi:uridine kinase
MPVQHTGAMPGDVAPPARVVLLSGPSGSGKSTLARRAGLPSICLDDFYKDLDDPTLPRGPLGVDWESPQAWDAAGAVAALTTLCRTGAAKVPIYDLPSSRRTGTREVSLHGERIVVAEGLMAAEIIQECREAGILADVIVLHHPPAVTFWRRLARDLSEGRKPPLLLVRRGLALWRAEPAIMQRYRDLGATLCASPQALDRLRAAAAGATLPS